MPIVAEEYDYVTGIDTHSRTHTYAIINTTTNAGVGCESFPVIKPGMDRAIVWIRRTTSGEILAAIEVPEEQDTELSMLCGFDDDLAKQGTATSNRIRGLLTCDPPGPGTGHR
ncbi:hypothetical protein GCM10025778_15920 [Paeniglutamicibacter antarcticus]|uniref:Transposase n=1 Tax=Paeniglutamicibacter antarcticus TaxID=494023 RepID=A0ABP9TJR5_9MICC